MTERKPVRTPETEPIQRAAPSPAGAGATTSSGAATQDDPHGLHKLAEQRALALEMGGPEKIAKQHDKGRLTARERITRLLDPDTFHEYALLARSELPEMRPKTPAEGKLCGDGLIEGRRVFLSADDATVLAGAGGRLAMLKVKQHVEYAIRKGFPVVNLGDAAGVRMPDNMGSANMMRMAQVNYGQPRRRQVPVVATILGDCYGDPSWTAARADVVVMVKGCVMAVAGPRILGDATGERVSKQELGGWEVHARTTGQVDLFAEDEAHCFALVRQVLGYLPSHAGELPPVVDTADPPQRPQEELLKLLPASGRVAFNMHKVLDVVFDRGSVLELKPLYDRSLITALARLDGHTVGILANNSMHHAGAMGPAACEKATSFICLCDSFHIPLLTFHDTPGFYVSKAAEERKLPLKIMTYLDAWHQSTVPRIGVIVRKSYGIAHRNMIGAGMSADYLMAWPTADVSFMAPEGAVSVVFGTKLQDSADPQVDRARYLEIINTANQPWEAAEMHQVDAIIDPRETRVELIAALQRARGADGQRGRSARHLANWPTGF